MLIDWLILALLTFRLSEAQDLNAACGKTKSCFTKPTDCVPFTNCTYFLSHAFDPTTNSSIFELFVNFSSAAPNQYVAVGFSKDQAMGQDAVTYCVRTDSGKPPLVGLGYNPDGHSQTEIINDAKIKDHLTLLSSNATGTTFLCRLSQKIVPSFNNPNVWNLNNSYYFLLVSGKYEASTLKIHPYRGDARFPMISDSQSNPSDLMASIGSASAGEQSCVSDSTASSLVKAHGILMIFGWWLFIATGILSARYFRSLWEEKKLLGSPIWFNLHRGINGMGVLIIAAAGVCIFIRACGTWTNTPDIVYNHSVVGLTASVCAYVQPLLALVRCHPGTSKRPIFNWVHRIIGVGGFCCACAAIWLATNFQVGLNNEDGYGVAPRGMIIFYYATIVVVVLCLEALITVCERVSTGFNKSSNTVASPNQFRIETPEMRAEQAKNTTWDLSRIALLVIYVVITIAIGITLACFIGIGPQSRS